MKLFYGKGTCSLAIRILLQEINVSCDYELVDLRTKKTQAGTDYVTINSKGNVPALQTDTGEILTENTAIQQYLAETYKATTLLPPTNDFKRYRVLEWLSYVSTDLHKGFGPLFNPSVPQEVKDTVFIPLLKSRLHHIDTHLSKHKYLVGDDMTLPDTYLFAVLRWVSIFKLDLTAWPNVTRFVKEMQKRKSVQTSLQEEGLQLTMA